MRDLPELLILRHGETEWNRAGRFQGRADSPLTELGRAQAAQQAAILRALGVGADSHAIFTSPQGRARETALIICADIGGTAQEDADLVEIAMGEMTGQTRADMRSAYPHLLEEQGGLEWYFRVPGGERFEQMQARAEAVLSRLTRPTVLVTHGITSRFLRGAALGLSRQELLDQPGGQGVVYRVAGGVSTLHNTPSDAV